MVTSTFRPRNLLIEFALCCLAVFLAGQPCAGQLIDFEGELDTHDEFFPASIYDLRPAHVRMSSENESAGVPRSNRYFPFMEAPPATPAQDSIRLTTDDLLTLVYPSHAGSYHSGGVLRLDQIDINGHDIVLDVFHVFPDPIEGAFGKALLPQAETGLFLGLLPSGLYDVMVRNWMIFAEGSEEFDPQTFEPTPDMEPGLSSFQFTVNAIPEPSSLALIFTGLVLLAKSNWRRFDRGR